MLIIGGCLNGRKNGSIITYWPNGKLKQEAPYTNDTINGVLKEYNNNGELQREVVYKKGVKVEEDSVTEVYDTTKLRSELFFTKHDLSNVNSILIETYKKGSYFSVLINREYNKIETKDNINKTEWPYKGWGFTLRDKIDIQYDYRFFFNEGRDTVKYDLKDMKFKVVCIGGLVINGNNSTSRLVRSNLLGEYKLNGVKFDGSNIYFK